MRDDLFKVGEEEFHVTVNPAMFGDGGFEVTIWQRHAGMSGFPPIRDGQKAKQLAQHLYTELFPEWQAERQRQDEQFKKFEAEQAAKPKPKPPRIPKNAPVVEVFQCPDCQALVGELSDERVYECQTCGTTGTGDDGRRCDQCNRFAAKASDTSCPECGAATDEAEKVKARQATNGEYFEFEEEKNRRKRSKR